MKLLKLKAPSGYKMLEKGFEILEAYGFKRK